MFGRTEKIIKTGKVIKMLMGVSVLQWQVLWLIVFYSSLIYLADYFIRNF